MYLPRNLLSHLYNHLVKTTHPLSPPVLILVSLEPDAICACRILTALLKRDYIPHKVQPVAGYSELAKAGQDLVRPLTRQQGGDGGVVVCLGVGGLIDLEEALSLDQREEDGTEPMDHGVEVWVVDGRRPWNLQNVFGFGSPVHDQQPGLNDGSLRRRRGVQQGKLQNSYTPGRGGIIVFDDGDIEQELSAEAEAFCALQDMPELGDDNDDLEGSEDGNEDDDANDNEGDAQSRKRKSFGDDDDDEIAESDLEDGRPAQRRRSNSGSAISSPSRERTRHRDPFALSNHPSSSQANSPSRGQPSSPPAVPRQPSARVLRRQLLKLRRKHENVLQNYYALGTSYSEPTSSMLYNLAEELGREDNDLLWLAIVGVSSLELYGQQPESSSRHKGNWSHNRQERIRQVLRDEVRRLNPTPVEEIARERDLGESGGVIPTTARSPTDTSIRLSPEPRFLLIRHWSLYDSMLHSPYLACRLNIWSEAGRKRLDRLLTKMGVSLDEARKGYTHMDMELKRGLRQRLLKFAPMYGLDGLIPPTDGRRADREGWGFVRCFGWKACLSAIDVAVIIGAMLEVGVDTNFDSSAYSTQRKDSTRVMVGNNYSTRIRALPTPDASPNQNTDDAMVITDPDWTTNRFFAAYDALAPSASSLSLLLKHVDTAKHLHRAILRTGSALMNKHQIRHLRAFRMGVVREGPDVPLFVHPGALVKLAAWVAEAVGVLEAERGAKEKGALVLGALDETRGVYVVVGLGGGGAGKIRSRAEQKEREERRKKTTEEKEKKMIEKATRKAERKRLRREREEANGIFRDEDEEAEDSDDTEEDSDSDASEDDSDDEEMNEKRKQKGYGLNKFGSAFQEVVEETGARVRIDSFEHCVVEVKKEDFSGFLEALSLKSVIG